tara:strand:- start:284 stop:652 length:369 start_codon:yes stop_codon:yes gene_type:complete
MSLSTKKTIKLENLSLFGFHGVNEIEKINGQNFIISLEISFDMISMDDNIKSSIDYMTIYEFIKKRFNDKRFNLIESLAQKIIEDIVSNFTNINHVIINVRKPSITIDDNKDFINVELEYYK